MVKMPSKGSAAATPLYLCLLVLLLASSPSCLVRRRIITRKSGQPAQTLLTADKERLIKEIADQYAAILENHGGKVQARIVHRGQLRPGSVDITPGSIRRQPIPGIPLKLLDHDRAVGQQ